MLDPRHLMAEAEELTGLRSWGGLRFVEGLSAYCEAVNADEALPETARGNARATALRLLTQRLALYRDRSAHPEIAGQQIRRPVIITGLPRAGSTVLHGALAQDPRARSIMTWEHEEISPPARAETFLTDPRIARAQARLDSLPAEILKIHDMAADLPDECNFVTALAFQSINLLSRFHRSSYVDWYLGADDTPAFELHRHALQHTQAFCPRAWWVLKSPPHIFHLARIFETYPDARVVFLHRDPGVSLPSIASLFAGGKRQTYGTIDPHRHGRETLAWWAAGLERAMAFRASSPFERQIRDVRYQDLAQSPMEVIATLYEWLGLDLAPAATRIQRFLDEHPKDRRGVHAYAAEDYGYDPQALRLRFADYIDAYAIPTAG
jgi:hypothetical protein